MSRAIIVDQDSAIAISPQEAKATVDAADKIMDVAMSLGDRLGAGATVMGLATVLLRIGMIAKANGCDTAELCRLIRLIADAIEHHEPQGSA